ncbi:hypothetical protein OWR29_27905 [Actinoplanes sp. Pm04-4]|uniref:DUF2017 domain-containing protein n=1 Tax=Paractinoplanes pyxinae TaxID=2997416 RepID=A0ABT4B5S2_9ACTN|nr:hypothetical protein [Actinoplanes pyxinae]MCY1141839.1 hypothetical protein [Actinoplanes pyxinae]
MTEPPHDRTRAQIEEQFRARMAEQDARDPLRKVRDLLQTYVEDAVDLDEVRADMASVATHSTRYLRQELEALEWVLTTEQPKYTLLDLVEGDANKGLDHDPTDSGAAVFLWEVARILREVLDEAGHR